MSSWSAPGRIQSSKDIWAGVVSRSSCVWAEVMCLAPFVFPEIAFWSLKMSHLRPSRATFILITLPSWGHIGLTCLKQTFGMFLVSIIALGLIICLSGLENEVKKWSPWTGEKSGNLRLNCFAGSRNSDQSLMKWSGDAIISAQLLKNWHVLWKIGHLHLSVPPFTPQITVV